MEEIFHISPAAFFRRKFRSDAFARMINKHTRRRWEENSGKFFVIFPVSAFMSCCAIKFTEFHCHFAMSLTFTSHTNATDCWEETCQSLGIASIFVIFSRLYQPSEVRVHHSRDAVACCVSREMYRISFRFHLQNICIYVLLFTLGIKVHSAY